MTSFAINNYKVPLFTINKFKARLLQLLTWPISLQKNKNTTNKIATPVLNFIYCNCLFYSHLGFPAPMKTSFVQSKYQANKFVNLSCPIRLAFNFKCYFILLILIYDKIRLSLAAVCPIGPCKNCSLIQFTHVCKVGENDLTEHQAYTSLQNFKKPLDTYSSQIERKRSKEYLVIILAVKESFERFSWLVFIFERSKDGKRA